MIECVKKIHARAENVLQNGIASLPGPVAMDEESWGSHEKFSKRAGKEMNLLGSRDSSDLE